MALQSERLLDSTDWKILRELQQDSRLSYNELGRRVGLSAPAAGDRVHKLVVHMVTASVLPHRVIDWEQLDEDFDLPNYPGWSKQ